MKREPAVAGQFYPFSKSELSAQLKSFFALPIPCENKKKIIAAISPHAGYVYSGPIASYTYRELKKDNEFSCAIIIGPNHTGYGPGVSIFPNGSWKTPLGEVKVDEKIAKKISNQEFVLDESAHEFEHSIEVQIPFLQYLFKKIKIVPICLLDQSINTSIALGNRLAEVIKDEKTIVIASTDFSHYIPYAEAYARDYKAMEAIKNLDEKLLFENIEKYKISMCGPGGVAAAIVYSKKKGAKQGKILKYGTSGDIIEDKSTVVGYGSLILEK